ncbi:MAG TPA: FAD-linked oxidase C-terminal domain-containing protein [Thermoleophilaceae bacterium]|nr:FAD-linked oxidase C-terminal domain-containing protein [Thermoleophilaceae bacterium]
MIEQLAAIVGDEHALAGTPRPYGSDATGDALGFEGRADAVVRPADAEQARRVVSWCYDNDVPIVPRGGGTGFSGGAVPIDGGVVVSLERLTTVHALDPALWRMHVDAGVTTATVARLARESGLLFPPNPGAAEQSQIGGNVATNAGGPRAFKYGVTGRWVTGIEAVVAPGELVRLGGFTRKDVAGYDLRGLLIGSEGTLGIVTSVWLSLLPAPEAVAGVVAFYPDVAAGCRAIEAVLAAGLQPAAIEFADGGVVEAVRGSFPERVDAAAGFMVLLEIDGSAAEVERIRAEAVDVLGEGALTLLAPEDVAAARRLERWRDGFSGAVTSIRGGKLSEDVAVPVDRLAEIVDATVEIGAQHGLQACGWGHAGDGNVHATFLVRPGDARERSAAAAAAEQICDRAVALGGTYSGEHGTGWLKRGRLDRQWGPTASALHDSIKQAFDPKGLFNPGKKR